VHKAGIQSGLVFVESDHGFNLGFDPEAHRVGTVVVARHRGDAHDRLLWESLGRPAAYVYKFDFTRRAAMAKLAPWAPVGSQRFEAEAQWPPVAIGGGWARPAPAAPCRGRGLWMTPSEGQTLRVELHLGPPLAGLHDIRLQLAGAGQVSLSAAGSVKKAQSIAKGCDSLLFANIPLGAGSQRLWLELSGGPATLDYLELLPPLESRH
jgi:hypothetical protein